MHRLTVCLAVIAVGFLIAGCDGDEESQATTSTMASASTTTSTAAVTSTTAAISTTSTMVESSGEPPVINLAGYTTVWSQDGALTVRGWLDMPATVTVGEVSADVTEDPVIGISTFEAELDLEPGSHAVTLTATDESNLENEVVLSVQVDPSLEVQLAIIEDVDPVERTVVADYVEFLTGDEATTAAREDGALGDDEDLPGGFYLRNEDAELQTLDLGDPEVVVLQACFTDDGPCVVEQAVDIDGWVELLTDPQLAEERFGWVWYGGGSAPYRLTLKDNVIVQISEQYLP